MKHYLIRFDLVAKSPLHIGVSNRSLVTDMPVFRDAFNLYRIPGTSLAGVLRSAMQKTEPQIVNRLFGKSASDNNKQHNASSLSISDGYLRDFDMKIALEKCFLKDEKILYPEQSYIRDCVRIDNKTGAAKNGGKFDQEVVPAGTRFAFELLYIPLFENAENEAENAVLPETFPEQQDDFRELCKLLRTLESGALYVGGDVTRGLGHVQADDIKIYTYDISQPEDLLAWIQRPAYIGDPVSNKPEKCLNDFDIVDSLSYTSESGSYSGQIKMVLETDGPLLIGGSQGLKTLMDADLLFLEMPIANYEIEKIHYAPYIPGSSVKGCLRHGVFEVARCQADPDADGLVESMFGSIATDSNGKTQKSKITVHGHSLENQSYTTVQHVAIDRLTGGSLMSALYAEAPVWNDELRFPFELRFHDLTARELNVLTHTIIDLCSGRLPIGAGTRRGNGRFRCSKKSDTFLGYEITFSLQSGSDCFTEKSDTATLQQLMSMINQAMPTIEEIRT